jgi:CRP/FNR family transcriptional regulator, cyclic AMP receptor protein
MQKSQPTPSANKNDPYKLLAKYRAGRSTADYLRNQDIFVQGQVADTVFFIQKGRVKITVTSEHGKEAVVAILNEGQFFGEGCLNDQPPAKVNNERADRLPDNLHHKISDAYGDPRSTTIL